MQIELIPGFWLDGDCWNEVTPAFLAAGHTVHTPTLPGKRAGDTCINDEMPVEGDRVPLPDWSLFEPEDLVDLSDSLRERFRAIAKPEPVGVAHEPTRRDDAARFAVPVTVIASGFPADLIRQAIANEREWAAELAGMQQLEIIELPTGHWPQFTKPAELGASILTAIDR